LKPRNDDVKNACPYRRPHDGARTDMHRAFAQIGFRNIEREEVLAGEVRAQGFLRIEERRIARAAAPASPALYLRHGICFS
jgi:hypothetical protein